MEIFIAFAAIIVGFIVGRVTSHEKTIGNLRIDRSDPYSEPLLFLELDTSIHTIMRKQCVAFRVKIEDFMPRK